MRTTLHMFAVNRCRMEATTAWYLNDLGEFRGMFRISEMEQLAPGVSRDMIRHVLREQQSAGIIGCTGRGTGAVWSAAGPAPEPRESG